METLRVAIVGSRHYPDLSAVAAYVDLLPAGTTVVSGGAHGVDQAAEWRATQRGLRVQSIHAEWDRDGRRAFMRNTLIVESCDRLVAFWDGKSVGTKDSIDKARMLGKPVRIFRP